MTAVDAEERSGTKRARAKPTNVSQSLGRLSHVKTRTVTWLRAIEKLQAKDAPISAAMHTVPGSKLMQSVEGNESGTKRGSNTTLHTPMATWGAPSANVQFTCSFCAHPTSALHVRYNYMLPLPYTVSCNACVSLCGET